MSFVPEDFVHFYNTKILEGKAFNSTNSTLNEEVCYTSQLVSSEIFKYVSE